MSRLVSFVRFCYTGRVKTVAGTAQAQSDVFAATHWSVIIAAGDSQIAPEAATQSFFAYLIEKKIYARADQQKGKFRSFLLASLKNFLADSRDHEQALRRGGAYDFLPLNEEQVAEAESMFQTHFALGESIGEDGLFERSWAEALVAAGLEQLAAAYRAEGKEKLFQELKIFLTGSSDPLPSYADLAVRLGVVASTLRSHVTRLRAQYRKALRAEVSRTVNTEAEVDEELRELLRVLTGG
ncbi:MAG: hypothetical protein DME36_02340 [Verrucomicrobia bacterium]|nr:MAG: hypothetical protein DME36_02340 [Verrucomicrobiota bacterium]